MPICPILLGALGVCLDLEGHRGHLVLICPMVAQSHQAYTGVHHPGMVAGHVCTPTYAHHEGSKIAIPSREGRLLTKISRGEIVSVSGFKKLAQRASGLLIQIAGSEASQQSLPCSALADSRVGEKPVGNHQALKKKIIENHPLSLCLSLVRVSEMETARQGCPRAFCPQIACKPLCLEGKKR